MSGGLEWAYEQQKAEEEYEKHKKSGKFNKDYLESDIIRHLTFDEITLLVVRLVHHHLGGWKKFIKKNKYSTFHDVYNILSKKEKIEFIKREAQQLDLEFEPSKKIDKFKSGIKELLLQCDLDTYD